MVEDEEAFRRLIRKVLETRGYVVIAAEGREETLHLANAHDGVIRLLVTDVLPGMSGRDLAGRMVSVRQATKMLYVSAVAYPRFEALGTQAQCETGGDSKGHAGSTPISKPRGPPGSRAGLPVAKDFGPQGVLESRSRQYHRAQGVRPEAIRFPNRGTGL